MKTSNALLMSLGLVSSLALGQTSTTQSTSNPNADEQQMPSDVRTQPDMQSGTQSLGTPSPAQSDTSGDSADSRLGTPSPMEQNGQPPAQKSTETTVTPVESSGGSSQSSSTTQSSFDNRPAPAPMSRLEPQTVNGVTYMCGGVGDNEVATMKRSARDYDMMLTFATKRGEYLADVNVDIKDAKGKPLMHARCDGPIMLVDFPQGGTYRVHAETGGYSLDKTARVSSKQNRTASVVMHWPQQIGEGAETSTGSSGNTNNHSSGPADPTGQGKQ